MKRLVLSSVILCALTMASLPASALTTQEAKSLAIAANKGNASDLAKRMR